MGIRQVVCKCAAGGTSPECTHTVEVSHEALGWRLALAQLQRPRLAATVAPGLG